MATTDAPSFGELLRRFRVATGLTQEELAERSHLSARTVSDIERGITNWPYRDTITLLADALGLSPPERGMLETAARRRGAAISRATGAYAAPPSEVRTFLVAEARGYPSQPRDIGPADAQSAAWLEALAREEVATQGGQIVDLRPGQALAVFGSARQALRAALALQRRCKEASASDPTRAMALGIGLDAGQAGVAGNGDHGDSLKLATELCSLAGPGEVLASAGAVHLARKTEGLVYVDRGEIALPELAGPTRVAQVLPEGETLAADARMFTVDRVSDEERQKAQIATLYRTAQSAVAADDLATAAEKLQRLLALDSAHGEAIALLQSVRQRQELPDLYSRGCEHYDAGRWRVAMDYFRRVQELGGNYKGVFALMATAQHEIEQEAVRRTAPGLSQASPAAGAASHPLDPHYRIVVKAFAEGLVVPFLGPDVNLCGRPADLPWRHGQYLPSGGELAAHLAENFDYPWADVSDLVRVSQYITIMTGPSPLFAALHGLFGVDYPATPAHQFLASVPGVLRERGYPPRYQLIVTTTYDDVLERAFRAAGEPFDLVSYVAEGEYRGRFMHYPPDGDTHLIERPNEYRGLSLDQRTIILKMHGAVNRDDAERDSYVITEDHHIDYMARVEPSSLMPVTLLAKLRTSHLLFLGYGLRDWNQRIILHRLWGEQKLSAHYKSWAVQANSEPIDQEFWNKRDVGILPVRLDEYIAVLSERLQALPRLELVT